MKKVEFQGAEFEVPDWARWIAQDRDGSIWAYENQPKLDYGYYEPVTGTCESIVLVSAPCILKEIK